MMIMPSNANKIGLIIPVISKLRHEDLMDRASGLQMILIFQQNFNWLVQASKPIMVTAKQIAQTIIIHDEFLEKEIYSVYCQE